MARILLNPGQTGGIYGAFDPDSVFGTAEGDETVTIAGDAKVEFDPSFNRGGDIIKILGAAGDYHAQIEGTNVVLTSAAGADISIPVGGNGTTIVFNGGDERVLVVDGGVIVLGDQTIPVGNTGVDIDDGIVTPTPTDGDTFRLTTTVDELTGTVGDDLFRARVAQNPLGEQTNQLGTGDYIDGGAGTDTLDAQIQDASPLNGGPGSSIKPETVDVEIAHFEALTTYNPTIFFESYADDRYYGVEVNAADMIGLDEVGSVESDASLTVYNVNTLTDSGDYDDRRLTQSVRVRMDHTGNGDTLTPAANLNVLFDQDYLLRDTPNPENSSITLQLLDIDNQINDGLPLLTNPFDRLFLTVDGVAYTVDYDGNNNLSGLAAYQALATSINAGLAAAGLTTLTATVDGSFTVVDPDGSPGGPASGYNIVITDTDGSALVGNGFGATGQVPANTDYQKEVFSTPPELTETLITVDVDLYKVGRGGDGGHLIIGGMDGDGLNIWGHESGTAVEPGVEQFILHVEGDDTQDSSLAGLYSTNNALRVVVVADEGDADADLVIGNDQTFQGLDNDESWVTYLTDESGYVSVPPGGSNAVTTVNGVLVDNDRYDSNLDGNSDDSFGSDLTSFKNLAFKDVLVWDSTAFDNDVTLYGMFTTETVAKYLDLTDTAADPRADNGNANYAFGSGDDLLNLNFAKENFAINGTATREDFTFTTTMGAGDDHVQIQIGNGYSPGEAEIRLDAVADAVPYYLAVQNWYYNHVVNQYSLIDDAKSGEFTGNPDGQLAIYTEEGDDVVELWGSTAAVVRAGSGDDDIYTDNSGEEGFDYSEQFGPVPVFNEGKATWVFNTLDQMNEVPVLALDVQDLQTATPYSSGGRVGNLYVEVVFEGIESQVYVGNTDTSNGDVVTDLKINNAIKEAITGDRFLNSLLSVTDGPGNTLIIESKIDGVTTIDDLTIGFGTTTLTAAQVAAGLTPFGAIGDFSDRYESVYAAQDGHGVLYGIDSYNVNNNIVEGDTGEDVVVYSSNVTSVETFDINGVFTGLTEQDVVMNFTAAVADEPIAEVQTVTFEGEAADDGTASVTINGVTYSVALDGNDAATPPPTTAEEVAAALVALINADAGRYADAVDNGDGSITLTYLTAGIDYGQATATITPADPVGEIQSIEFGGAATTDGTLAVLFAGVSVSINVATGDTPADIVDALVAAFAGTTVATVDLGDIIQIEDTASSVDYGNAQVTITSDTTSGVTFEVGTADNMITDNEQDGSPYGLTVDYSTDVTGAVPALGYDIFDVEDVIGGPVASGNFANDTSDNAETATIASLNLHARGVAIIDTVEVGDGVATSTASEAARIQQIVRSLDTAGSAQDSIIITVDSDNIGHFYLVDNGSAASDAVVSHLGNVELGQYDDISKEYIGNWDAMTIANFTPLTTEQIVETFAVA
ncbi:hypothetical protein [Novosphingobium album (ex Liu et al. 2023)]|uniref:Uncharacterized protein n=1 Tax=Novosphingobium album (ex Liu et al. 2023) TaxID=3031130 RepID=A0ABT5WP61_9SPHN|nr:hypothetical protein [Novosphingobium album (ex Liu et al. 2023)]MDE8651827.1 hypothetical protein [Novosphingobium album (ex Liu et al. 2023)]